MVSVLDQLRDNTPSLGMLRLDAADRQRFPPIMSEDLYNTVR